jgi:thymidylate synthase (FAD)
MSIDPYFKVSVLSASPNPQKAAFADAHQCYSENAVADEFFGSKEATPHITWTRFPDNDIWHDPFSKDGGIGLSEKVAGERLIKHCLKQKHWGVIESPSIHFAVAGFPHVVMQQARTHRIGIHFGVQSFRYTSKNILAVTNGTKTVEEVFYTRPVGNYVDRQGKKYEYTDLQRQNDLNFFSDVCSFYSLKIASGMSEEHARGIIPYDVRQNFTVSFNIRSLFHFLDMRTPLDAQLEIRQLCDLMWPHVETWIPELAAFYYEKRWSKNNLAP